MARVTGIGGFFFRAGDPDALNRWYEEHLGIVRVPKSYEDPVWTQDSGETVFSAFPDDSEHIGPAEKTWKLNLRVDDLAGMVESLRAAGIEVEEHAEPYPNGLFAEIEDPEGNRIQLWEPKTS